MALHIECQGTLSLIFQDSIWHTIDLLGDSCYIHPLSWNKSSMNYHILQTNFCYCKSIFWESYQFIMEWSVLLKDYCKKMLTKSFFIYLYSFNIISLASEHDSVVMDVRQVAQRLVVQAPLCLSVLNVYCVFGQGPFSSSFSLPRWNRTVTC